MAQTQDVRNEYRQGKNCVHEVPCGALRQGSLVVVIDAFDQERRVRGVFRQALHVVAGR